MHFKIMGGGCQPSMLELIDKIAIIAANKAANLGLPEVEAILLFEADGMTKDVIDAEMAKITAICEKHKCFGMESSYEEKERARIWPTRQALSGSFKVRRSPFFHIVADDMAVPFSKMAVTAEKIHEVADNMGWS